ncbi:MAG: heavy metal translocating P-type ATPase [Planctomycetota bacterium]|nr:heavy metal translocating P-type ATPase [Planctomycetota bacterium]
MNKTLVLRIQDMDCAEEVAILKKALVPLVGNEDALGFDLLKRRLTLEIDANGPADDVILQAVAQTGMQAEPWTEQLTESPSFWRRRGRVLMCILSGLSLALGFLAHATLHGIAAAIQGHGGNQFPIISMAFYICASVTGAWFVLPKAFYAARQTRPDMNLLMVVAVIGAMALGEWFEAGTVSFLFAFALLLESWSVGRARRAIESLLDLAPATARYLCPSGGEVLEKLVNEVPKGVTVLVRPGEKIPLDGIVTKGTTTVNQAPITGESIPVDKVSGDEIFAGTINNQGAFEFRSTSKADDSTLARIIQMVETAQTRRARSEQWVEKFARIYTPVMMLIAFVVAFAFPLLFSGGWEFWIYQALVVLVIACPCALVISTPVSIVAGLATAARCGVLIKGGSFLEAPALLKVIAMDKTGTLTKGEPEVQEVVPFNEHTRELLLRKAACLEANSEHPLARAVVRKAEAEGIEYQRTDNFQSLQGRGVEANLDGKQFWLGSHRFMHEKGNETPEFHAIAEALEQKGCSVIAVGTDDHVCGLISVSDSVREESVKAIRGLKNVGIERVVMLTGDHATSAATIAEATGVDEFHADLLPEDKVHQIEILVREYGQVAMVGDGINDAPAMAAATLGIAMGTTGTDAAIETADIALMADDLSRLPWLIQHSRRTLRIIRQNVFFALGLKALVMVLVMAGKASLWMAIAADMGASLLVIFNALRLLQAEEELPSGGRTGPSAN